MSFPKCGLPKCSFAKTHFPEFTIQKKVKISRAMLGQERIANAVKNLKKIGKIQKLVKIPKLGKRVWGNYIWEKLYNIYNFPLSFRVKNELQYFL